MKSYGNNLIHYIILHNILQKTQKSAIINIYVKIGGNFMSIINIEELKHELQQRLDSVEIEEVQITDTSYMNKI